MHVTTSGSWPMGADAYSSGVSVEHFALVLDDGAGKRRTMKRRRAWMNHVVPKVGKYWTVKYIF